MRSLLLALLLFWPANLVSLPPEGPRRLAGAGVESLLRRDYSAARLVIERMLSEEPDGLLGILAMMSLAQIRNFENVDFRFDAEYRPWGEKGKKIALETAKGSSPDPWTLVLAGGILGLSGFDNVHKGHWFSGLSDAVASVRALRKAREKDPKIDGALLGIGLHEYWRSYYTRSLRFLPFFPDRREEGREMIAEASKKGLVASLALFALAYIEFREGKTEAALGKVGSLVAKYPENTVLRMLRGRLFLEKGHYREAREDFVRILSIDPSITKCHLFLGLAASGEGKKEEARNYLRAYLALEKNASKVWRTPAEMELAKLEEP